MTVSENVGIGLNVSAFKTMHSDRHFRMCFFCTLVQKSRTHFFPLLSKSAYVNLCRDIVLSSNIHEAVSQSIITHFVIHLNKKIFISIRLPLFSVYLLSTVAHATYVQMSRPLMSYVNFRYHCAFLLTRLGRVKCLKHHKPFLKDLSAFNLFPWSTTHDLSSKIVLQPLRFITRTDSKLNPMCATYTMSYSFPFDQLFRR